MLHASAKLREARFFLRLLTRIEETATPLLGNAHEIREEYSFVLSGFLNACYSALEQLKATFPKEVKAFKTHHAEIYGQGLRNVTVHERHISPSLSHYITLGGRAEAKAAQSAATRQFEYYFDPIGEPVQITTFCSSHFQALLAFSARFDVQPDA